MKSNIKINLDFYSNTTGEYDERDLQLLEKNYSPILIISTIAYTKDIIFNNSYYIDVDQCIWLLFKRFAGRYQPKYDVLDSLINDLCNIGYLDSNIYKKYRMLTNKNIQANYYVATIQRKNVIVDPKIWLLMPDEMVKLSSNSSILSIFGIATSGDGASKRKQKNYIPNKIDTYSPEESKKLFSNLNVETSKLIIHYLSRQKIRDKISIDIIHKNVIDSININGEDHVLKCIEKSVSAGYKALILTDKNSNNENNIGRNSNNGKSFSRLDGDYSRRNYNKEELNEVMQRLEDVNIDEVVL